MTPEPKRPPKKILLRLPVSLHRALVEESKRDGISLNQLVVMKLSMTAGMDFKRIDCGIRGPELAEGTVTR